MNENPLLLLPGASGHGCCSHITSVSGPEISLILNVERNFVVCKTGCIFSDSPSTALGFDNTNSTIVKGNACPSKFGNNCTSNFFDISKSLNVKVPFKGLITVPIKSCPSFAGTPCLKVDSILAFSTIVSGSLLENVTPPISSSLKLFPPLIS